MLFNVQIRWTKTDDNNHLDNDDDWLYGKQTVEGQGYENKFDGMEDTHGNKNPSSMYYDYNNYVNEIGDKTYNWDSIADFGHDQKSTSGEV